MHYFQLNFSSVTLFFWGGVCRPSSFIWMASWLMSSVRLRIPAPHGLRNTSLSDCWQRGKKRYCNYRCFELILVQNCHLTNGDERKIETISTFFGSVFSSTGRPWAAWSRVRGPWLQEHWLSICENWNFKGQVMSVEWMFINSWGLWDSTQDKGAKGTSRCYSRTSLTWESLLTGS